MNMSQKETAIKAALAEVIDGLELHISKVDVYDIETLRAALNEDLGQLKYIYQRLI